MGILKYNILIIIVISVFCFGCNPKQEPISYMLLKKHSGKTITGFKDKRNIYIYIQNYLVDNLIDPVQKEGIDLKVYNILFDYFKVNNKICLLEDDITYYSMSFYRKTKCTKYFINNFQDNTGISQTTFSDCNEDQEYSFYYKRNEDNPNMWVLSQNLWGKQYYDTIYCDPNRTKLKLPDVPH